MGIRKQFLKTKPVCKVTFTIPEKKENAAKIAHVVGEFNDWSTTANPMKRLKKGGFSTTVDLETGRSYQFRYLLEASHWENDSDADGYLPTPYGDSRNSVIQL
ncbi:isoamylase early set domain-containing protein [uncultured Desulfosarcina sp.]|uniref:isoamylase early set domain-containing protein n=1 Tax=uncultured Desulfosarcina sp. TaxID=218289 RepID=UPI0029C64071|nr:isoamylase early set domain-containing protein [uncultured Desulfosarcina sp.]